MTRPVRPDPIGPGEESVWRYPRPPALESTDALIEIRFADTLVARTHRAHRVLETSHPPSYYLPPADIRMDLLEDAGLSRARSPLAVLLKDHDDALDYVVAMFKALPGTGRGEAEATERLIRNATAYDELRKSHVEAEEFVFEFGESVLSDADDRSAVALFRSVDRDLGEDVLRRYLELGEELARRQGAPEPEVASPRGQ